LFGEVLEELPHLIFDPLPAGLGLQIDGDDAVGDALQLGRTVRPSGTTSTSGFSSSTLRRSSPDISRD
jgi:hypothetical protein